MVSFFFNQGGVGLWEDGCLTVHGKPGLTVGRESLPLSVRAVHVYPETSFTRYLPVLSVLCCCYPFGQNPYAAAGFLT